MNKSICILFAMLCTSIHCMAQDYLTIGARAGLNIAWQNGYETWVSDNNFRTRVNNQNILGPSFGAHASYELKYWLAVQTEINFLRLGGGVVTTLHDDDLGFEDSRLYDEGMMFRTNHLQMPFLIKFITGEEKLGAFFNLGPYVGYRFSGNTRTALTNYETGDIEGWQQASLDYDGLRRFDAGFVIGGGFMKPLGKGDIFTEVRYTHSFSDMFDIGEAPKGYRGISNRAITISFGYMYPLGKMGWIKEKIDENDVAPEGS
ncbi:porin family protein [Cytophagaceae bacterium ABcell3]|nr:porin family protein [Cytophagaceae bacterium ABcell3]